MRPHVEDFTLPSDDSVPPELRGLTVHLIRATRGYLQVDGGWGERKTARVFMSIGGAAAVLVLVRGAAS